ncbi:MAG: phosphatidate cytidylyltransferase [Candidatus Omnitrophica bacterium]|nr:phosphatidate cytidylyltransferase [Candidatus Omnitrophota bacterium]MBU1869864.1 phosphatidate cytidylyltransferase [Candidatus Omnitrophota bacterium]
MLKNRIISSSILIIVIAASLFVDWHRMLDFSLAGILVIIFIVAGLYEFFTMLENKGLCIYKYFGITMGTILPLSILLRFELTKRWELLFIMLALFSLILMQFRRRNNSGVVVDISTTLFGILYVSWFFSFLIKITYLPDGVGYLISVVLITKLGDIGAFLIGSRFGKTPLIPRISPKKSVEGAIGGLFFSVLAALACKPFFNFNYLHIAIIGVCLGILGQLGDLSESLIKRDCKVKDSGSIFPGLGGVLDSIDSVLFTAPAFYFYLSAILK